VTSGAQADLVHMVNFDGCREAQLRRHFGPGLEEQAAAASSKYVRRPSLSTVSAVVSQAEPGSFSTKHVSTYAAADRPASFVTDSDMAKGTRALTSASAAPPSSLFRTRCSAIAREITVPDRLRYLWNKSTTAA